MDGEFAPPRQAAGVAGQGGELHPHPAAWAERQQRASARELRLRQQQRARDAGLEAAPGLGRGWGGRKEEQQHHQRRTHVRQVPGRS